MEGEGVGTGVSYPGAAWVFTRSGSTWSQQCSKLQASDETGQDAFGSSVALSTDGSTGLIGSDSLSQGAAWVFTNATGSCPNTLNVSLTGLSMSPRAFKAAASGPSTQPVTRRSKRGTVVRYKLTQAATVRFTIERLLPGRKTGKGKHTRCLAPTKRNRNAASCTRIILLRGSFSVSGKTGTNAFRFTGRLAGKTLAPGNYTLIATPRGGGMTGNPASVAFRVIS